MWKFTNDKLMQFQDCFSRKAALKWFVIIIIGLIVRTDHLGVTSIIRALSINPRFYESIIHFFHSDSWEIENIRLKWIHIVAKTKLFYRICGKPLLIGDGVKQTWPPGQCSEAEREGNRRRGVKCLASRNLCKNPKIRRNLNIFSVTILAR